MLLKDNQSRKSREQKFIEFYESLQIEYIVAELRYNIYPDGFRRNKSLEIMNGKKDRIFQIATQNRFKCIFEDFQIAEQSMFCKDMRERLYCQVYPKFNTPNFHYRDNDQKEKLSKYDIDCYYSVGSEFEIPYIGVGVLKKIKNDKIFIDVNNYGYEVYKNECQRFLKFLVNT